MRTNEGWFRVDASGAQPTSILEKPKKAPQAKRQRCPEDSFIDCAPKRQDRKHALELDVLSHDNGSQVPTRCSVPFSFLYLSLLASKGEIA